MCCPPPAQSALQMSLNQGELDKIQAGLRARQSQEAASMAAAMVQVRPTWAPSPALGPQGPYWQAARRGSGCCEARSTSRAQCPARHPAPYAAAPIQHDILPTEHAAALRRPALRSSTP